MHFMEKNKPAWLLHITYNSKLTWNRDLNVKGKTIKLKEKKYRKKIKKTEGVFVF